MERSFARATRYEFDRARHRGLWKVAIQEYLVCAVQNIMTLISRTGGKFCNAGTLPLLERGNMHNHVVAHRLIGLFIYLFCIIAEFFSSKYKMKLISIDISNKTPHWYGIC